MAIIEWPEFIVHFRCIHIRIYYVSLRQPPPTVMQNIILLLVSDFGEQITFWFMSWQNVGFSCCEWRQPYGRSGQVEETNISLWKCWGVDGVNAARLSTSGFITIWNTFNALSYTTQQNCHSTLGDLYILPLLRHSWKLVQYLTKMLKLWNWFFVRRAIMWDEH